MQLGDNKHKIFCYLIKNGVTSRKKLAEVVGISSAAITKITNKMIEDGIIKEVGIIDNGSVGRKSIGIEIVSNFKYLIGFDITTTSIRLTITTLDLRILFYQKITYKSLTEEVFANALDTLDDGIKNVDMSKVVGIGLAVQGYVSGYQAHNLSIKDCYKRLVDRYEIDVMMLNNVRALAVYEQLFSKIDDDFMMLKYGPGVGGVFMIGNKIYDGNNFVAGEFGHINWGMNSGSYCQVCKKHNCLESDIHILNLLRNYTKDFDENTTTEEMIEYLKLNAPQELEIALTKLAHCVDIVLNIMDIDNLMLVGSLFEDEKYFALICKLIKESPNYKAKLEINYVKEYKMKRRLIAAATILNKFLSK